MFLNIGNCTVLGDFHLLRLEVDNFDGSVDALKESIAEMLKMSKSEIDLIYAGKVLNEKMTLTENGLQEEFVVHAVKKSEKKVEKAVPINPSEYSELIRMFKIMSFKNAYRRLAERMVRPEAIDKIIVETPGLREDDCAIVFLQHPELMSQLQHRAVLERMVKHHPALGQAGRTLFNMISAEIGNDSAPPVDANNPAQMPDYYNFDGVEEASEPGEQAEEIDIPSNSDSNSQNTSGSSSSSHGSSQGTVPQAYPTASFNITPEMLANALQQHASTSNAQPAQTQRDASTSTATASITPAMISAALEHAFAAAASTSSAAPGSSQPPSGPIQAVTAFKLEQLHRMGFSNDARNVQALELANGNIDAAVNILMSQYMDDYDD